MAPKVFFWGRTDDDGDKVYCHVRVADCHGKEVTEGACGVCGHKGDSLMSLNMPGEDGGDNTRCKECFGKARASELRKCQPGAVAKREANPFNTPEKKKRKR